MSDPNEKPRSDSKNRSDDPKDDSENRRKDVKPPSKPPTPPTSWDDFEDDTSQLAFFGPNAKRPPKGEPPVREPFPEDKQPTVNITRFQAEQSQRQNDRRRNDYGGGQRTFRSRGDRPDQGRPHDPQRPYDNRGGSGQQRPYDNRGGGQQRPYDNRGGGQQRPPQNRGPRPEGRPDNRGQRPYDNRGGQQRPPDNRGPRLEGRPDNRGPRPEGRPDNRGPRPEGRDNRGPGQEGRYDNRGPRPEGRQDNRGPRPESRGPRPEGRQEGRYEGRHEGRPDSRGPRPDNRGPRPDNRGPRPDNRGPRPDHQRYDQDAPDSGGQQRFDPNQRPRYDRSRANPDAKQVARLERTQREGKPKRIPGTTLLKALVSYQFASRGISLLAIHAQRVTVNDEIILQPNHYIKLDKDVIAVDGHVLQRKTVKPITLIFHKPHGLVGSKEEYRRTMYSFLTNKRTWFVPSGALPKSAAGIVVVSNDTAHKDPAISPLASFTKDVCVKVHRQVKKTELTKTKKLLKELWGDENDVIDVEVHQKNARNCWIMVRMHKGRIRDIAKVLKSQGIEVLNIERRRIGPFSTDNLSPGAFTRLTDEEVLALDELARTKPKDDNVSLASIWKHLSEKIFKPAP